MIVISEDVWGSPFEALAADFAITRDDDAWSDVARLKGLVADAQALVVRNRTQVTAEILDAAPQLKVIARAGVGLDNIDIPAADARGIAVVAGLGANAVSVGELTVGLALAVVRSIASHDAATRAGSWNRTAGRELSGATWGLVGCGATGIATANLLRGFGVRMIGFDPYAKADDPRLASAGITLVDFADVLRESDVISVHVPATDTTRDMFSTTQFAAMKQGAVLVSVGRGEVIDEGALAVALSSGHLGGAGLDVRAQEPPHVGVLETLPTVVLTPHVAGITRESQLRINEILASNIRASLTGQPLTHAVGAVR